MHSLLRSLVCGVACAATSCSMSVHEARSHVRAEVLAWEDTTRIEEGGVPRTERSVNRSAARLGWGGGYFDVYDRKLVGWEMTGGRQELDGLDAWSLHAQLRWYWPVSEFLRPYASLGAGGLYLESLEAAQGEVLVGLGAEFPLSHGWFADLQLDYHYPAEPALDEIAETIETEFEGWGVRIGLGWEF